MARYHGGRGAVYASKTGTGTAVLIPSLSNWTLDKTTDTVDVTSFGDLNKTYVQGLPDIKGSISGFFDSADDSMFDGTESADGVKLYLYRSTLIPSIYDAGPAWLSSSIEVPVSGAITGKWDFVANGTWGRAGIP